MRPIFYALRRAPGEDGVERFDLLAIDTEWIDLQALEALAQAQSRARLWLAQDRGGEPRLGTNWLEQLDRVSGRVFY